VPNRLATLLPTLLKGYLKKNWGAPFIAGFIILLAVAAVFVSLGCFWLADAVAVYGFYSLLAGVFLQLVCFLKYSKIGDEKV
jgi:hypothetical protein